MIFSLSKDLIYDTVASEQQCSNVDVIYDLKGLNQYGSYSLHLKYSTNS